MGIGIEKLGVYPCSLSLDIAELCAARGLDAANFCGRLFCDQRSVIGPFEDVVTLAVNAAMPMLTDADRDAIRLLIVATESSPDQEKPVSSWVHHFLGLAIRLPQLRGQARLLRRHRRAAGGHRLADVGGRSRRQGADHQRRSRADRPQRPAGAGARRSRRRAAASRTSRGSPSSMPGGTAFTRTKSRTSSGRRPGWKPETPTKA